MARESAPVIFWGRRADAARAAAAGVAHAAAGEKFEEAVRAASVVVVAVSSAAFVGTLRRVAAVRVARTPVVWLTKGFDPSGAPLCAVADEVFSDGGYGVVSGPSFAAEVARGLPAALSLAVGPGADAAALRALLHRPRLRLYEEADVVGVCVGGAVKNIIAIAAGICDGLRLGENARAALLARGLAEMSDIAAALGGGRGTLLGLCGVGDLALTCCSDLSRNRRLGLALAAGGAPEAATCEGVAAAAAAARTAAAHGVDAPIIAAVAAVLEGRLTPAAAADALLARPPRVLG